MRYLFLRIHIQECCLILDGLDLDDLDACILALEDEVKRQSFQTDFQIFAKQMDIILPDPAANSFHQRP